MIKRFENHGFCRFRFALIAAPLIWMIASAASLAPPPIDKEMAERAIGGAEWLAELAKSNPHRIIEASGESDIVEWLLIASGADEAVTFREFAHFLAGEGYEVEENAVQRWLREFSQIATVYEAARQGAKARSLREVEAEIATLPSVPLDEEGQIEREALFNEKVLATVSSAEREAVGSTAARMEYLLTLIKAEVED